MLDKNIRRIGLAWGLFSLLTLCFPAWAAMAAASEPAPKSPATSRVQSGEGWTFSKPALPEKLYDKPIAMPWGKATEHAIIFSDEARQVFLTFANYAFAKPPRRMDPKLLKNVPKALLKHRKCTILSTSWDAQPIAEGTTWPTIVFTGNCVGGDQFRWAVLIANDKVFSFQVAAFPSMGSVDLNRTLTEFMAGFRR